MSHFSCNMCPEQINDHAVLAVAAISPENATPQCGTDEEY